MPSKLAIKRQRTRSRPTDGKPHEMAYPNLDTAGFIMRGAAGDGGGSSGSSRGYGGQYTAGAWTADSTRGLDCHWCCDFSLVRCVRTWRIYLCEDATAQPCRSPLLLLSSFLDTHGHS